MISPRIDKYVRHQNFFEVKSEFVGEIRFVRNIGAKKIEIGFPKRLRAA